MSYETTTQEQSQADALQMLKIGAEAQIETKKEINLVDANINKVGSAVVASHKSLDNLTEESQLQTNSIEAFRGIQNSMMESVGNVSDALAQAHEQNALTDDELKALRTAIDENKALTESQKATILSTISENNDEYTRHLEEVNEQLQTTHKFIQESDRKDQLSAILADLASVGNKIDGQKESADSYYESLDQRFNEAHESLEQSVAHITEIDETMKQATKNTSELLSRLGTLEAKLTTLVPDEEAIQTEQLPEV